MDTQPLTFSEIETLAGRALTASRLSKHNAVHVARSVASAERDRQPIVGVSYLPTYCGHAACGKVDGFAIPRMQHLAASAIGVVALLTRHGAQGSPAAPA